MPPLPRRRTGGVLEMAERRDGQQRVPRHVPLLPAASLAGAGERLGAHVSRPFWVCVCGGGGLRQLWLNRLQIRAGQRWLIGCLPNSRLA